MKFKGILALVCALSLTLALAGCGGAAATQEPDAAPENISETVDAVPETTEDAPALPPVSETMTVAEDIESYLSYMPLSRTDLLDLLVYDGFSEEEATAAVDNAGIDWNAQAVRQAVIQMETLPDTAYDELVDYLESVHFTHEQAVYAADNYAN